jgi:predicted permease
MSDLRFAFRQLLKNPGFTAVAVLSLGLGIGACTAVFSIVNGVLLRSLPLPNPDELRVLRWEGADARLRSYSGDSTRVGDRLIGDAVSPPMFLEMREQAAEFADLFSFAPLNDVTVFANGVASSTRGMIVSDSFFSGLGARPFIGRLFDTPDAGVDPARQVVIATGLWTEHFFRDPNVLGRTVSLNGEICTIVGVLPDGFPGVRAGDDRSFYVLMTPASPFNERAVTATDHWWVRLMARMKPGADDARLKAALDVVFARAIGDRMREPGMLVQPGRSGLAADRDEFRRPLLLMLGVVGVVLLVACANLAGLSLARGAGRRHELAVRSALGAGRWRLLRQSFAESIVLALAGGLLGGLLGLAGRNVIAGLLAGAGDGLHYDTSLNLTVLGFGVTVALVAAVLSGLLPALRAAGCDPLDGLKSKGALDAPRLRTGRVLVVGQICLSVLLLTAAGLYLRTVVNLRNIDTGFNTENLLVFKVNPVAAGFDDTGVTDFYDRLQPRLDAIPGVRGATLMMNPLLDNETWSGGFQFPARAEPPADNLQTHRLVVGETYFATMGIPLLQGRSLSTADRIDTFKAVVVNETFAQKYLPGENPVGQVVNFLRSDWQIVGVCGDTKYGSLKEPVPPTAYLSFRQIPLNYRTSFAVRTALPPLSLAADVREAVAAINPAGPVARVVTQTQLRDGNIGQERLFATLCGGLAALALLLSCLGLYGLMAYTVARRTNEIAIRMAVGASPGNIAGSFVREAFVQVAAGIGLGIPAVLAATRLVENQLYGVPPNDPFTLAAVVGVLLTVALAAAWLPARRAARIDPMLALRNE